MNLNKIKGLGASIFKDKGQDCSNDGISSRHDNVIIVGVLRLDREAVEWMQTGYEILDLANLPDNAVILKERKPFGNLPPIWCAIPAAKPHKDSIGCWMAGGTFIATSDSRFSELMGREFYGAVAFHDRTETQEEYDMLSH